MIRYGAGLRHCNESDNIDGLQGQANNLICLNFWRALMLFRFFFIALCCLPLSVSALTLQAEARAATAEQAKREALAALAESIFINVKSDIESHTESGGRQKQSLHMQASSDVPLIGVEINAQRLGAEFVCVVKLDAAKSLAAYNKKVIELLNEINELDNKITRAKGNVQYALLTHALTVIEQYEKYKAVAQLLGESQFSPLPRSRQDTEAQLRALEKSAFSLELAAQILSKNLKAEKVFIYPAVPQGSHEVTAFGRVMRDRLAQILPTVERPDQASQFFKGEYEILENGIHLTYRLLDSNGNTLLTRVATLAPAAYQGLQVQPVTVDFDRLLHQGVVLSNNFRVQLSTNHGGENVLFIEKQKVKLLVKLNRPGYFYVVGHVLKAGENQSYLLELGNADSDRRFVRFVNADEVDHWIAIGGAEGFEASAPFGVESLQVIASSDDPLNRLPPHVLNRSSELYVIAENAQQGLAKTRALKPIRSESDKVYQQETVLMFTTMKIQ
jgi:hypothetical protein